MYIINPGCLGSISLPQTSQSPNFPLLFPFGFTIVDRRRDSTPPHSCPGSCPDLGEDTKKLTGVQSRRDFADSKVLVLFLQIGERHRDSDLERDKIIKALYASVIPEMASI